MKPPILYCSPYSLICQFGYCLQDADIGETVDDGVGVRVHAEMCVYGYVSLFTYLFFV